MLNWSILIAFHCFSAAENNKSKHPITLENIKELVYNIYNAYLGTLNANKDTTSRIFLSEINPAQTYKNVVITKLQKDVALFS